MFSHAGDRLLSVDARGLVRLWSLPDGAIVRDLSARSGETFPIEGTLAFSPDDRFAAASSASSTLGKGYSGTISIWSVPDGQLARRLVSYAYDVLRGLAWSPDGRFVASGGRLWCLDDPRQPPEP